MSSFTQLATVKKLQNLASHPFDLTKDLTPDRIAHFSAKALGFTLFYGTERIDESVLSSLFALAKEAGVMEKMIAMQSGAVINRIEGFESEERSVLHTAMRDVFADKQTGSAAKQASASAERELVKLERFLDHTEGRFTDLIQIGIGGSDLGPRALCMALEAFHRKGKRVHFISNVDPDDACNVLSKVDLKK